MPALTSKAETNASAIAFCTIDKSALKRRTGEVAERAKWITSRLLWGGGGGREAAVAHIKT